MEKGTKMPGDSYSGCGDAYGKDEEEVKKVCSCCNAGTLCCMRDRFCCVVTNKRIGVALLTVGKINFYSILFKLNKLTNKY